MDSALICNSGEIQIGTIHGMTNMVLIAIICVIICYCVERAFSPKHDPLDIHTSILNAHALYMLELEKWKFESE
ncbi:hypothetical protein THRCLA_23288 [Thraustotheca clavata]|uniref:Uncharacterized protein n=1 Tax=Thraustotheca clavata TaxID=74557 RepID=A0A1V9Y862_9STRA|nr:hypothetical protein THRCLA_23288 [Thraustotheca clavata]